MTRLRLEFEDDELKWFSKRDRLGAYTMATGYFLDHIFKYCPNLSHLSLQDRYLIYCNPNMSVTDSITELFLGYVTLGMSILLALSFFDCLV